MSYQYPRVRNLELSQNILRHIVLGHRVDNVVLIAGWSLAWPVLVTLLLQTRRNTAQWVNRDPYIYPLDVVPSDISPSPTISPPFLRGVWHSPFHHHHPPVYNTKQSVYKIRKRSPDGATTECIGTHIIAAYYSYVDPERMKGWIGLLLADIYSGRFTNMSGHQIHVIINNNNNNQCKGVTMPTNIFVV